MPADAQSSKGHEAGQEIMRLLEAAFKPIDPPTSFVDQLESRLLSVEAAAIEALEELSDWELDAMRDPRNWVRPVTAVAVGTAAGAALVVLGMRSRKRRTSGLRALAEQGTKVGRDAVSSARGLVR